MGLKSYFCFVILCIFCETDFNGTKLTYLVEVRINKLSIKTVLILRQTHFHIGFFYVNPNFWPVFANIFREIDFIADCDLCFWSNVIHFDEIILRLHIALQNEKYYQTNSYIVELQAL